LNDSYTLTLSETEKNLVTGSLLNLKAELIAEQDDYEDVSDLIDKIRKQRPLERVKREPDKQLRTNGRRESNPAGRYLFSQ